MVYRLWRCMLLSSLSLICLQCSSSKDIAETPLSDTELGEQQEVHIPLSEVQRASFHGAIVTPQPYALKQLRPVFGKVGANQERYAHVVLPLSGRVRAVYAQCGDKVHAGQPLALLDSPELSEAVANYVKATHEHETAQQNLTREERLFAKRLIAENTLRNARALATEKQLQMRCDEQKLFALGLSGPQVASILKAPSSTWNEFVLTAPLNAEVLERDLVVGEWVSAQHGAFVVADLDSVWAGLQLPVTAVKWVKLGSDLDVIDLMTHEAGTGKVVYISPSLNQENMTVDVVLELDNHARQWHLGACIEAQLAAEEKKAELTLPLTALQRVDGKDVVFVEGDEGFFVKAVELGCKDAQRVEILAGVDANDACLAENTFVLKSHLELQEEREEEG